VNVAIFAGAAGASPEVAGFFDAFDWDFETLEALGRLHPEAVTLAVVVVWEAAQMRTDRRSALASAEESGNDWHSLAHS